MAWYTVQTAEIGSEPEAMNAYGGIGHYGIDRTGNGKMGLPHLRKRIRLAERRHWLMVIRVVSFDR